MKIVETETQLRQMLKLSQIKRDQIMISISDNDKEITSKNVRVSKQNTLEKFELFPFKTPLVPFTTIQTQGTYYIRKEQKPAWQSLLLK